MKGFVERLIGLLVFLFYYRLKLFQIDVFVVDKEKDDGISSSEDDHERDMFGKSHRGIFFGFILIAGVVIVIAFFNFSITDLVRTWHIFF